MKKFLLLGLSIIFATSCVLDIGSKTYADASSYSVMNGSKTFKNEITELKVNWTKGSVKVDVYDEEYVSICETANLDLADETRLHYYLDGTVLNIQFCQSGNVGIHYLEKDLLINLPKTIHLSNFVINNAASNINFSEIITDKASINSAAGTINGTFGCDLSTLSIDSASGYITIGAKNIETYKLDSASGVVSFTGNVIENFKADIASGSGIFAATYLKNVILDSNSGSVKLSSTENAIDSLTLKKTSGDMQIYIPENDGFVVNLKKVSGVFNTTFDTTDTKTERAYGNKNRIYTIKMTSGSIKLIKITE